jgi:hypothetical protein
VEVMVDRLFADNPEYMDGCHFESDSHLFFRRALDPTSNNSTDRHLSVESIIRLFSVFPTIACLPSHPHPNIADGLL